jgi:serine phosphatase RsbU (regulator of sigma subunit)
VSGDFVWLHHQNEKSKNILFFAVADCTGHGVPGGFMSMLGSSFLNETVIEKKLEDPAQILNNLRNKVISALKQNEASAESKDGMDIVFIKIDLISQKLSYAAANNSFYILRKKNLIEYKPDKMPIGVFGELKPFNGHDVLLEKGDQIFIFTDGYADQFGGEHGKKFKYMQLEKLFVSIGDMKPSAQREWIHQTFHDWKKLHEQVDDICITGIRIS